MIDQRPTTFQFLEHPTLRPTLTVERSTTSKHQFYLVVAACHRLLGTRPQFFTQSRSTSPETVQGIIEEHSFWSTKRLIVLEGFPRNLISALTVPDDTHVVAETEDGDLRPEPYAHSAKRDALKALSLHLDLKLSLRALLKLDWDALRSYEEYETLLRKAQLMGWPEERIGVELTINDGENPLVLLKKGDHKPFLEMMARFGATWLTNHVTELTTQTAQFKALKAMGYEDDRAAREMGTSWYRTRELRASNETLTQTDLLALAQRLIQLDPLLQRNRELGLTLFALNNPISVRRR